MHQPRLDHKVTLLKREEIRDPQGFASEVWQDLEPAIWAGRERVTANEQTLALQTRATQVEKLNIRYIRFLDDPESAGSYRVRYNGRVYVLVSALPDYRFGRNEWMTLTLGFVQGLVTLQLSDIPAA